MNEHSLSRIIGNCQTLQAPQELIWLCNILEDRSLNAILEVGVFEGGSLRVWEHLLSRRGILVGIEQEVSHKTTVMPFLEVSSKDVCVIWADSTLHSTVEQVQKAFKNRHIDFLYLDGNHTYTSADWKNFSPLVRKGGIIALHDISIDKDAKRFFLGLKQSGLKTAEVNLSQGTGIVYV